MRCSLDKVLLDARQLANKIRATDESADILIKQASDAHNKIIAKKQCQEEILSFEELNQVVKERPRSRLMMCIAAENKQLEILKQENKILRTSLKEYETTFEMIIQKFRKHKSILKKLDELKFGNVNNSSFNLSSDCDTTSGNRIVILCSKVTRLKSEIEKTLIIDNKVTDDLTEIETKLRLENTELRRLLDISNEFQNSLPDRLDLSKDSLDVRSQKATKIFQSKKPQDLLTEKPIVNGIAKEKSRILSSTSKMISKFPIRIVNNHFSSNTKADVVPDRCATFSDDDDDHSSVASDASVKTLI